MNEEYFRGILGGVLIGGAAVLLLRGCWKVQRENVVGVLPFL